MLGEARTARRRRLGSARLRRHANLHPVSRPPRHRRILVDDDDDAAVARLMDEYEALKAERQALAARLAERQRAEAAESAKIEAELEALAAETVALNREMARREASVYADGPMPPEETRPRQFRRKPSGVDTGTPWRPRLRDVFPAVRARHDTSRPSRTRRAGLFLKICRRRARVPTCHGVWTRASCAIAASHCGG